jgi:hypothetical protein
MVESHADNVLSNHVTSGKDLSLRYTITQAKSNNTHKVVVELFTLFLISDDQLQWGAPQNI